MAADVSIVIAAYNVGAYIERAIRSALGQHDVTVEVITVNDGSTDDTATAVARIADARLRSINLPANAGPGAARNAGFDAATAPWIAVLDADDSFAPDRLTQCLKAAREQQADIVVDNIEVHRESDGNTFPMFPPHRFANIKTLTLPHYICGNSNFLGGSSLGYLKPVFSAPFLKKNKLRYDTNLRIGEDYLLMAEALACGTKCAVIGNMGYRYTARDGSTSHRLSLADVTRITDGDKTFLNRHKLDPLSEKMQKRRAARLNEAYAFTQLVDAIKQRNIASSFKTALSNPLATLNLWRPVWAKMRRQ